MHSLKAAILLENSKKFPGEGHSRLPRLQWGPLHTPGPTRPSVTRTRCTFQPTHSLTHAQPLTTVLALAVYSISSSKISNYYTVGHKKGATFIFTITLANVDRFQ